MKNNNSATNWEGRDVISISDFSTSDLDVLFNKTDSFIEKNPGRLLEGKIIVNMFLEPSTRTRLSFEIGAKKLGAEVINVGEHSSLEKKESYYDTFRMIDGYNPDMMIMRVKLEGAPRFAAEVCKFPVISGGEGTINHPTQAMIDLYTIRKHIGRLDNLNVGIVGDLRYGRAAVSFILGISKYKNNKLHLISPEQFKIRPEIKNMINSEINESSSIENSLEPLDILYVTRIQKERIADQSEYQELKDYYSINKKLLTDTKKMGKMMVLHPLPRNEELAYDVDNTPSEYYFREAGFGVPVRQAMMSLIMGV
jgi:aspartate carbamoyltransferase catalytic subunit